jgi:ABC-type phosphate transport system substrate-binding protein
MAEQTQATRPLNRVWKWLRRFFWFFAVVLVALIGVAVNVSDLADSALWHRREFIDPKLCIIGSNTVLGEGIPMAAEWESNFEQHRSGNVVIIGTGSVRGFEMARDQEACTQVQVLPFIRSASMATSRPTMLAMSEPITEQQLVELKDKDIEIDCAAEIAYDVIAFITDINNPVGNINVRDLPDILTQKITNWSEIGGYQGNSLAITLFGRPKSGTTEIILNKIANLQGNALNEDRFPLYSQYYTCSSNDVCLNQTLSTPGSLYWVSTAWMHTQPPEYLKIIPILKGDESPINPLTQEVDLNEYPIELVRPLYLYVLGGAKIDPSANRLAREFLDYVRGVQGQQIVEKHHFYAHFDKPRNINVTLPPGFEMPDTTTGESGLRTICRPQADLSVS